MTSKEKEDALDFHKKHQGKIEVRSKVPLGTTRELSLAYTPGVAHPCLEIKRNPDLVYDYTSKGNLVAVVTDSTAILGLGDIGPLAGVPLVEGKCVLFKKFAGIDAFPICLDTKDPAEFVSITKKIAPVFGGINLEDIAAPRCFKIESELKKELDIPVFHDDQHGTAVVVLGALINALKIVGKELGGIKVVMSGAGAAGIAVAQFLLGSGIKDLTLCDSRGIICEGRENLNPYKEEIAKVTNPEGSEGSLADAMKGADVFIGVSVAGIVSKEMVRSMKDPIVFAMANPAPEIMPEDARAAGAKVVATGRSDLPNQVNNALGFPGIFRGALDVRASDINEEMKRAAANAIAELVDEKDRKKGKIIPTPFDRNVVPKIAKAVAEAAVKSGVARLDLKK